MKLTAKFENGLYRVYNQTEVFGTILMQPDLSIITLADGKEFSAKPESDAGKDIVLYYEDRRLFKFKFDYLWGNAELISDNTDDEFKIMGKWFKPGTRLTDDDSNDLVVAISDESMPPDISIDVLDNDIAPVLIMSTVYYHLYTSANKTRSLLMNNAL